MKTPETRLLRNINGKKNPLLAEVREDGSILIPEKLGFVAPNMLKSDQDFRKDPASSDPFRHLPRVQKDLVSNSRQLGGTSIMKGTEKPFFSDKRNIEKHPRVTDTKSRSAHATRKREGREPLVEPDKRTIR